MLQVALEEEVAEFVERHRELRDAEGKQAVVRNGFAEQRTVCTGAGPLEIRRPRVDERKARGEKGYEGFTSSILPRYMRRSPTMEGAIALLYLKGISTNDFPRALEGIFGEAVGGLSATTITRLKRVWEQEYEGWRKAPLQSEEYAYVWADGVHFNVRLDDERSCILVVMGANSKGRKELLAIQDGFRESTASWREVLLNLKARGMKQAPKLAIADGALGFWAAAAEVFPTTRGQRCWVHKTANVLEKMPKSVQSKAKGMIHDIYGAETKEEALGAYDHFVESFRAKYPKAVDCLKKDKEAMFEFYDFPAEHWKHIRSTNVIESVFATVRLRTYRTKGCGTRIATLTMVFKLVQEASRGWRRLDEANLLEHVMGEQTFVDGVLKKVA
jgi:transposase-like protein